MKYELEPENRNCNDDVLLEDLRAVAMYLGKPSLTKEDYNKHGRFCAATMQNRFGSWNTALLQSGLCVQKRVGIPREELLEDLRRVAEILGVNTISQEAYRSHGKFSDVTQARAFGSWVKAVKAAGFTVSPRWKPRATEDELFSNMADVWEKAGRQPKQSDFHPPVSRFSESVYVRRFGSWRKALEAFVAAANDDNPQIQEFGSTKNPTATSLPIPTIRHRTPRDPGWRLRFLVNRRDRFTCRACGRTPALDLGVVLDVDHVVAWSKGGETIMENLQTLCQRCNIGKSDLSMNEGEG